MSDPGRFLGALFFWTILGIAIARVLFMFIFGR
jgi:hypothetical protein